MNLGAPVFCLVPKAFQEVCKGSNRSVLNFCKFAGSDEVSGYAFLFPYFVKLGVSVPFPRSLKLVGAFFVGIVRAVDPYYVACACCLVGQI